MGEQNHRESILDAIRSSLWGVGIIATVLSARTLGAFHALELVTLDRLSTLSTQFSENTASEKITIVEIDSSYVDGSAEQGYTITANSLVEILEAIFEGKPTVIGTDILSYRIKEDDQGKLLSMIEQYPNLITVENTSVTPAKPLSGLTEEQIKTQVGFNDLVIDRDSVVRRALLGSFSGRNIEDYKASFAIQILQAHFQNRQSNNNELIDIGNGIRDERAMRFGDIEVPRIKAIYGYSKAEVNDSRIETFINYINQSNPFSTINVSDLLNSKSQKNNLIKDKIIILTLKGSQERHPTPLTVFGRVLNDSQLTSGIEIQAHIISQIIEAVDHQRPLINTNQSAQYIFFIFFSTLGIICSVFSKDTLGSFINLLIIILSSIFISYILLMQVGLWLPLAATLTSTTINGLIYINYTQNKRRWEKVIEERNLALENERQLSEQLKSERKKTIENMFDSIHNGPLQTLANLLRQTRDETIGLPDICLNLEELNRQIRFIGDSIKEDANDQKDNLELSYIGSKLDLESPLQELFQEIYDAMLSRAFLGFSKLKFTIISFDPIESETLDTETKRKLCRFLEEALANVGKHAIGATRLVVTGKSKENNYELTVSDNGPGIKSNGLMTGEGTRIGEEVEKITGGKFVHGDNKSKGFFCQLIFPIPT